MKNNLIRYAKQPLFFIVVLLIFFSFNYYIFNRMLGMISVDLVWPWVLISAMVFPFSMLLDKKFHSKPTIAFYYITSVFLGFLFLLFSILISLEMVNIFYPIFTPSTFIWTIFASFLLSLYGIFNGLEVHVKKIKIDNFGKRMDFVQLSDIHIGTIRRKGFLEKIIHKVNKLKPDFILITGDLVDGSGKLTDKIFDQLNEFKAPVFLVMGNHEFYEGESRVNSLLKKTRSRVLKNEFIKFRGINIIGMDYSNDKKYVAVNLPKIKYDRNAPSILMNHMPIGYKDAIKNGIKIQLSGHTHNGQIFPFSLFSRLLFRKISGLHRMGEFSLYVSPGTGTWGPPMRIGSRNEISFFSLI